MSKRACIVTLGCRLNQAETALLTDRVEKQGYTLVEPGAADVELVIINSCAVTATAAAKSRQAVSRYRNIYPNARIIAAGCAVEADPEAFSANPACDAALTNVDKRALDTAMAPTQARMSVDEPKTVFFEHANGRFPFRRRALVKIQEGCENFCSYCIVPYTRGAERSRSAAEVLAECKELAGQGVAEIVLTGVNTCAYSDGARGLGQLVREIGAIPGDFRIRLSSTEPKFDNLALLDTLAECGDKVCRFLHLSLQHGADDILRSMNRKYTTNEYAAFAARARELWSGMHLGTDVIVGYPGETEELFAESLSFIESMKFANIHIFTFSPRAGTPAAKMPARVPKEVARERYLRLEAVAKKSAEAFRAEQIGKTLPVIFETEKNSIITGWSDNYIEVSRPADFAPLGVITQVLFD